MDIRQSLIDAAGHSATLLGPRVDDVVRIIRAHQNPDGGFWGKGENSDLYYTGFALLSLTALKVPFDKGAVIPFLASFENGGRLADLAHLGALIRERVLVMEEPFDDELRAAFMQQVDTFRCGDGGYHHLRSGSTGSAYGCFLAVGACQDLGIPLPEDSVRSILACVERLRSPSGGFFNEIQIPAVSVPGTAAAMMVRRVLTGTSQDTEAVRWMLKCLDDGGFRVMPMAPVADLLSTAVALHSLSLTGYDLGSIRQSCLIFVDLVWNGQLGFCANAFDPISDPEYMFYGLLALGHLRG